MVLQGLGAAFLQGGKDVIHRHLLANKHMRWQSFLAITFVALFLILFPFSPFFIAIEAEMFTLYYLVLMAAAVVTVIARGVLHFSALKHSNIEKVEPLALSSWIFTILLALIFVPDERDLLNGVLALVATVAVLSVNVKRHHLKLDKWASYTILGAFFWGVHLFILGLLLEIYSPLTLVFVKAGLVSLVLLPLYRVHKKDLVGGRAVWMLLVAAVDAVLWILIFWSYQVVGIVFTGLLMSMAPLLAEWFAKIFLKEKLHWKNFVATAVIGLCISLSILY